MTTFATNPYISRFPTFRGLYYIYCQVTALHYQNHFFNSISSGVVTYITFTVTNISDNIKQYYSITKTFKILVIVKKKQFIRTNILISSRPTTLDRQAFFDFINLLIMPKANMLNSSNDGILLQIRRRSRIAFSFDGLNFTNVTSHVPICSPDVFKCISISP